MNILITESQYIQLIEDFYNFNNWKIPTVEKLKLEYKVEHELKGNNFFDSEEDFLNAVENANVSEVTKNGVENTISDRLINYRSDTSSKDELMRLIRSYRSYPQFRNEKTVEEIYEGYRNNLPMDYPIVIRFNNGRYRIFSGNTRMDVAFQLGINPKVLVINSQY